MQGHNGKGSVNSGSLKKTEKGKGNKDNHKDNMSSNFVNVNRFAILNDITNDFVDNLEKSMKSHRVISSKSGSRRLDSISQPDPGRDGKKTRTRRGNPIPEFFGSGVSTIGYRTGFRVLIGYFFRVRVREWVVSAPTRPAPNIYIYYTSALTVTKLVVSFRRSQIATNHTSHSSLRLLLTLLGYSRDREPTFQIASYEPAIDDRRL